ncbi:MAG: imidazoleglycerol-phosphate dehydratase HisB [Pleomorphochaeta sp.]
MKQNKGPLLFIECESLVEKHNNKFGVIKFRPSVFKGLSNIVDKGNFTLVMLLCCNKASESNSSLEKVTCFFDDIKDIFAREKIFFEKDIIDYDINDKCQKFTIDDLKMKGYLDGDYDISNSFIIGSKTENLRIAQEIELNSILYSSEKNLINNNSKIVLTSDDWNEISNFLVQSELKLTRKAHVIRNTKETKIDLEINLDGTGQSKIDTKIKFFDHMLEQISRHSDIDMNLVCEGDVDVDEHHSVEDVAIALGTAIKEAMGDKKGLARYGFNLLAMDEVLAQGAIDFSNRPYLVYDVPITREYIGSFPTEMFEHFFKSFSDSSKSTLHLSVSAGNSHHMIEAVYKCFAKCLKQALYVYPYSNKLPTTKGVI